MMNHLSVGYISPQQTTQFHNGARLVRNTEESMGKINPGSPAVLRRLYFGKQEKREKRSFTD